MTIARPNTRAVAPTTAASAGAVPQVQVPVVGAGEGERAGREVMGMSGRALIFFDYTVKLRRRARPRAWRPGMAAHAACGI